MEMAEEVENQIADTEEAAAIEGSEGGIIQVQQSEVASSEVGGFKLGSTVDVSISDKKMFVDPMWVQSFEQRLCDNKAEIYQESSSENYSEKIQMLTIQRVPKCLREVKEAAFLPQIVSIGPFHYEKRSTELHAMEEHKKRYLKDIRSRMGKGCLERFFAAVKLLEDQARASYSEEFVHLDSNSFIEMMVFDGCFIIELFNRAYDNNVDDPLLIPELRRELAIDLLKLENQIPFVILHHLFGLMNLAGLTLYKLAINFFDSFQPNYNSLAGLFSHSHLLHFLQCSLCPHPMEALEMGDVVMRHSASKLQLAGIEINKGTADSFLSIKFQKEKAVMEVSPFPFEGNTIQVLFNLVAMEQTHVSLYYSYFTTYTTFMNSLISSVDDVRLLCQSGIFDSRLGSNQVAVDLFNEIRRNITLLSNDFYLVNVINDINQCYGSKWQIRRAHLKRNLSSVRSFFQLHHIKKKVSKLYRGNAE